MRSDRDMTQSSRRLPLDGLILNLAVLIIQSSDHTIDGPGGGVVVMAEHVWFALGEDGEQVVQGHEAEVWIGIIQLAQQLGDGARIRVGR